LFQSNSAVALTSNEMTVAEKPLGLQKVKIAGSLSLVFQCHACNLALDNLTHMMGHLKIVGLNYIRFLILSIYLIGQASLPYGLQFIYEESQHNT
jgi:hypothetical protein